MAVVHLWDLCRVSCECDGVREEQVREKHGFFTVCRTPELACEVTMQPVRRYDIDAAIVFSDILVIPQALGLTVVMEPTKGPVVVNPITSPQDAKVIRSPLSHTLSLFSSLCYSLR